jgi:hypothetical protein
MISREAEKLAAVLGTTVSNLENSLSTSAPADFFTKIVGEIENKIKNFRVVLNISELAPADLRRRLNREALLRDEKLRKIFGQEPFEAAVKHCREAAGSKIGWFLKLEKAREILMVRPPQGVLEFTKTKNVEELLQKYEVTEIFSALRFLETNEWMHQTFALAYASLTPADFEEREIKIQVLGKEWLPVAQKFIAKKRHNVSHLKELGVIFLNPLQPETPGALLRDFALLFHYLWEIYFYSQLFRSVAGRPDFAVNLASFLRGDILEKDFVGRSEWLIVQRYLDKENPGDARLLLPRANPEALHWRRAERDLAVFGRAHDLSLDLWEGLDSAAENILGEIISFDLEDTLMSAINFPAGEKSYAYHQKEALWLELAVQLAGSEERLEEMFVTNFSSGVLKFN